MSMILLLLALGGLGVADNPAAPDAAEVMRYAQDNADLMAYVDAQALLPGNWKILTGLPDHPLVKGDADLRRQVRDGLAELEGLRQMVVSSLGFDPITDVRSVAVFVATPRKGWSSGAAPDYVVVVRGNFPSDLVDKVAAGMKARAEHVDGRSLVMLDKETALSTGADGSLLLGSRAWVRPRAGKAWKPQKGDPDGLIARSRAFLDAKPFLFLATRPSAVLIADLSHLFGPDEAIIADFLAGQEYAAVALARGGLSWTYRARDKAGLDRAVLASEGIVAVLRGAHGLTRGGARLLFAVLASYASDADAALLMRYQADLIKLIDGWSGDGTFAAKLDRSERERTVTVTASARTLAEIVPLVAAVVPGALLFIVERSAPVMPPPPPPPPPPVHRP
jgi:hypothetical protein